MDFNWYILDNIIFGYSKNLKNNFNFSNVNKIILFDLDNTLIKTKSKKVFPINKYDWEFLTPDVPNIINSQLIPNQNNPNTTNTICGIISNQKGLKNPEMVNNWIDKIKDINKKL